MSQTASRVPGSFITFEGPEGSGKTTQVERLRHRLESAGRLVLQTREPGGTVIGQELRAMLLAPDRPPLQPATEALLMCADRAQHVAEVVRPALASGMIVIGDRFADSTIAYQGFGIGLDVEALAFLSQFATNGLAPDLTVLIDIDVQAGLERKRAAFRVSDGELNRIDRRDAAYHERVRRGFLTLAEREPGRFLVVDGHHPVEMVSEQIWRRVETLLCLLDGHDSA